jgi:hypothetical protein
MGQIAQSWRPKKRDPFGNCSDLDAIEELERRSSEASRLGGLAPQYVSGNAQVLNRRDSTRI